MPRCRPKDNTDKFRENPNITLIQIEYLILGMPAAAAESLQILPIRFQHHHQSLPTALVGTSVNNHADQWLHAFTHNFFTKDSSIAGALSRRYVPLQLLFPGEHGPSDSSRSS